MKKLTTVLLMLLVVAVYPVSAAEDDAKARDQFDDVLAAFNDSSIEMLQPSLDQADLANRVLSQLPAELQVREMFNQGFEGFVAAAFAMSLHNPTSSDSAEVVSFEFQDGKGQAVVRDRIPGYRYAYLVMDLRHDRRGDLKVVDWFDTKRGQSFTGVMSDMLTTLMPTKATTRDLLSMREPTDLQLFQATEILKAARDPSSPRFFEIYADLDESLKNQPLIARFAMNRVAGAQDGDQFSEVLKRFVDTYENNPEYAAAISDFFVQVRAYQDSYDALQRFQQHFDVKEGGVPGRLSALALVLGDTEKAEEYALQATAAEPTFELGWWSLLRARAAVQDFAGCVEVLTVFEDNFDNRIDAAKLRRDPFRAFNGLAGSDEFKNWRAAR